MYSWERYCIQSTKMAYSGYSEIGLPYAVIQKTIVADPLPEHMENDIDSFVFYLNQNYPTQCDTVINIEKVYTVTNKGKVVPTTICRREDTSEGCTIHLSVGGTINLIWRYLAREWFWVTNPEPYNIGIMTEDEAKEAADDWAEEVVRGYMETRWRDTNGGIR